MKSSQLHSLFASALSPAQILDAESDRKAYGSDWCKNFEGEASIVLLPESTEQVRFIVQTCLDNKLALIPSGGRTGLCGAATATQGEIVLSLERMRKIISVNEAEQVLHCQAGATTEAIQERAKSHGLYYPVDLASAGSSQIGGNIATNAGGIHVIRYGSTRQWVLGLQVVTGKAEVLELNGALIKNQTGYDFRSLFIGSEGTLGVITEARLKLTTLPKNLTRFLCASQDLAATLEVLNRSRKAVSRVSAFEFFTDICLRYVLKHTKLRCPFQEQHPFYLVVEFEDLSDQEEELLSELYMTMLEEGLLSDILISQSAQQASDFMALRESIGETTSSHYIVHKNDISVPVSSIPNFVPALEKLCQKLFPENELLLFGHVGDGNIHLNLLKSENETREAFLKICHDREPEIFELIQNFGGSVSAEHGIGLLKRDYLHYSRAKSEIQAMQQIKAVFDPAGILNPGKVFPAAQ